MLDQHKFDAFDTALSRRNLGIYDHFCGGEVCAIGYSLFVWFLLQRFAKSTTQV